MCVGVVVVGGVGVCCCKGVFFLSNWGKNSGRGTKTRGGGGGER